MKYLLLSIIVSTGLLAQIVSIPIDLFYTHSQIKLPEKLYTYAHSLYMGVPPGLKDAGDDT